MPNTRLMSLCCGNHWHMEQNNRPASLLKVVSFLAPPLSIQIRTMKQSRAAMAAVASFLALSSRGSFAWQLQQTQLVRRPTTRKNTSSSQLSVLSEPAEQQQEKVVVPYLVSRGDGSTGGGGLPMPRRSQDGSGSTNDDDDDDALARPKVGAEMPKGRPSWFKVPAPSQGAS